MKTRPVAARVLSPAALVAAALAAAGPASARPLYVDAARPATSDEGPGTSPDRAFRTISAALVRAFPGDEVLVASGTYRETLKFPRSGAGPGRRIRVAALPGAEVWVKGSDRVTGFVRARRGVWKRTGWKVRSQQVIVDGRPLQQIGATCPFHAVKFEKEPILPVVGSGLSDLAPGSFFHDADHATLYVRLRDEGDPNAHLVEASVRNHVISAGPVSFVELDHLKFAHSNTSAIPAMMSIVNVEGKGWVVSHCTFFQGDFGGLSIAGSGHRVVGNVADENGDVGISINGSDAAHGWAPYAGRPPQDIVLTGNETNRNNYRRFNPAFQAGGLKAANSCNGVRLARHTAVGNGGVGVWFDGGCRNVTVEDSRLEGNLVGIEYEISERARIRGNVVTGSELVGIYLSASSEVAVSNNTLDDNGYGVVVHGMPRAEHPALAGNTVQANIIGFSRRADLVMYAGPGAADNASNRNVFYRGDGSVRISWTRDRRFPVTHTDLGSFARDTGHDAASSTADPRWRDRAAGDYRLAEGAPARRAAPGPPSLTLLPQGGGKRGGDAPGCGVRPSLEGRAGALSDDVLASPRARRRSAR
jgi:parallel beta-helix repeat protein